MDKQTRIGNWFLIIGFILLSPCLIYFLYLFMMWIIQMIQEGDITKLVITSFLSGIALIFIGCMIRYDSDGTIDIEDY